MKLEDFRKSTKKLKIDLDEGEIWVEYVPRCYTARYELLLMGLDEAKSPAQDLCKALKSVLVGWDIVDENGQVLPVEMDNLEQLPVEVVIQILKAIRDDIRPNSTSDDSCVAG